MSNSILEGNELIAVFMGGKLSKKTSLIVEPHWKGLAFGSKIYDLYYHSRWDWLMPVVEKIETLSYETLVSVNKCIIREPLGLKAFGACAIFNSTENSKIEAVFKSVVEFIKWYNKQNESK